MPLFQPCSTHDAPSLRRRRQQSCLGVSRKVAFTTYVPIAFAFRVLLQGRTNSPQKREISMGKTSGMPARQQADRMSAMSVKARRTARLLTPTNLGREVGDEIAAALTKLLADFFALYIKTKNFHWHVSGPHFRDYHLLLDEQASQIYEATDLIAERARKLGGTTIRSIRHVARLQRLSDNDAEFVTPLDMLAELRDDNSRLTSFMRETHRLCDQHDDTATASLLENW